MQTSVALNDGKIYRPSRFGPGMKGLTAKHTKGTKQEDAQGYGAR